MRRPISHALPKSFYTRHSDTVKRICCEFDEGSIPLHMDATSKVGEVICVCRVQYFYSEIHPQNHSRCYVRQNCYCFLALFFFAGHG